MKYKEIFKKWWFWIVLTVLSIYKIIQNIASYGRLFLAGYLGIVIGTFIFIFTIDTIFFLIIKLLNKLFKK